MFLVDYMIGKISSLIIKNIWIYFERVSYRVYNKGLK